MQSLSLALGCREPTGEKPDAGALYIAFATGDLSGKTQTRTGFERQGRLQNRAELKALMEDALAGKTSDAWWQLFQKVGVPAGPVYTVPEILDHPQVADRGLVGSFTDVPGVGRDIRIVRPGFKLNGEAPSVDTPPPRLGEHTAAIMSELGYSDAEIQAMKQEEVV